MSKERKNLSGEPEVRRITKEELAALTKKDIDTAFFEAAARLHDRDKAEFVRLTEFENPVFEAADVEARIDDPSLPVSEEGRWYLQMLTARKYWEEEHQEPPRLDIN